MNAFTGQTFQMNQIIKINDVIEFTSISRAKNYEMIKVDSKNYNPTFPKNENYTKVYWLVGIEN